MSSFSTLHAVSPADSSGAHASRAHASSAISLAVDLAPDRPGGLRLRHPILVAAGGAGFGSELLEVVGELRPGAIVTRGTTRLARRGEAPPRMAPIEDGLLSAIGHPEAALETVLRRHGPRCSERQF